MPGAGQAWVVLTACLVDQLRAGFESTRDNYQQQLQIHQQLQQQQRNYKISITQQNFLTTNTQQLQQNSRPFLTKIVRNQQQQMEDEYQVAAIAATKLLMMRARSQQQQQQFEEDEGRYQRKLSNQIHLKQQQNLLEQQRLNCECHIVSQQQQDTNCLDLWEDNRRRSCAVETTTNPSNNYYDYNRIVSNDYSLPTGYAMPNSTNNIAYNETKDDANSPNFVKESGRISPTHFRPFNSASTSPTDLQQQLMQKQLFASVQQDQQHQNSFCSGSGSNSPATTILPNHSAVSMSRLSLYGGISNNQSLEMETQIHKNSMSNNEIAGKDKTYSNNASRKSTPDEQFHFPTSNNDQQFFMAQQQQQY